MEIPPAASVLPLESALYELVTALQTPAPAPAASSLASTSETLPACVVCRLSARSVERWLRTFLSEYVNDPAAREMLRRAQGFCGPHTGVLSTLGEALAISILYADLARLTRERWQQQPPQQPPSSLLRRLRSGHRRTQSPNAPCPACVQQQEADTRYVRALAAGLSHPTAHTTVWNALETNSGLCVPHVAQIVAASAPPAAARLLELESAKLAVLQAELEEIVRKNDYRFRGEAWGEERNAWKRALEKLRRSESGE